MTTAGSPALAYGPNGLLGVLTPQANTTVEPEFSILVPPGTAQITAHLTSAKPTIDERLVDYVDSMEDTLTQFANAPVGAVAFACTGAAYLVDPAEEARHLAAIRARTGYPVITAANAVHDALRALDARRVGIISPYGDPLHGNALNYWAARGLEIARTERMTSDQKAFHPIYALRADASKDVLQGMDLEGLEAVAMLGTGLPTLPAILRVRGKPLPVISPNLCLVWRSLLAIAGEAPSAENLRPWITTEAWQDRYAARVTG